METNTSVNCGLRQINFYNLADNTAIDPAVFTQDGSDLNAIEFMTGAGPLTDISKAKVYNLYFTYYYS